MNALGCLIALIGLLTLGGGTSRPGAAAIVPGAATFGSAADAALASLEGRWYRPPGRWNICVPDACGSATRDWGADSLTYTLYLRWSIAHDASIPPLLSALATTTPDYHACRRRTCAEWSDIPMWDAVAAARDYAVTANAGALSKARHAFAFVDRSNAFGLGACASIDYQRRAGGKTGLKTLETDANYIKSALLLAELTGERTYLVKALGKYQAVRRYFLDPDLPLYSTYVFDNGRRCEQLPHRFFASVNGTMISSGIMLAKLTGDAAYLNDAQATARAVARELSDAAGVFVDLQAENDVAEPLIEAMYDLATQHDATFARDWLLASAAVAIPTSSGAYGRFFDGPAPRGLISAWAANGGFALAIAAGALDPTGSPPAKSVWENAVFVADPLAAAPASIAFTGRAIALLGTIGDRCCEPGHVRVLIDGRETTDNTGIWQNKSSAMRRLPDSVLLSWRWPDTGRHTIALEPGVYNAKEGGSAVHLSGYEYVP